MVRKTISFILLNISYKIVEEKKSGLYPSTLCDKIRFIVTDFCIYFVY